MVPEDGKNMASLEKKTEVTSIVESLQKSNNFLLVNFAKTTHQSLEKLRKELKKSGSSLKIIKNTLFEKAINKLSGKASPFTEFKKKFLPLKESSALLTFSNDWSSALHIFYDFLQKEKTLSFKSGLLDNQIYTQEEIIRIAKLPDKNQLMANIIGSLKAPMSKFVYAIKYNTNKIVYILEQKSKRG